MTAQSISHVTAQSISHVTAQSISITIFIHFSGPKDPDEDLHIVFSTGCNLFQVSFKYQMIAGLIARRKALLSYSVFGVVATATAIAIYNSIINAYKRGVRVNIQSLFVAQHWQAEVLLHSLHKLKQKGKVTRIVSGTHTKLKRVVAC